MHEKTLTLTEREKETLRLLLRGHDAKSIARHLDLSVHTINERLRDARRKLDVASSREAARLLAETERTGPHFDADKNLGVAAGPEITPPPDPTNRSSAPHRLAWLSGGMLIMSLVIAVVALSSVLGGGSAPDNQGAAAPVANAHASASQKSALAWLALLDRGSWDESWQAASALFKSQITARQWASMAEPVRQPLGPVSSRTFLNVTRTSSPPGAPTGEYEVIQFRTNFARKEGATETITMSRDGSAWRCAGYFIK